jgi:hypothetical protein
VFLAMLMAPAVVASAQTAVRGSTPLNPAQTASPPPVKSPPPPLFRKHHRGTYVDADGLEVVDATPQSPPLKTDDPSVPDKGEYEINLATGADLSRDVQHFDLLFVDANYGMAPGFAGHELPTQLKFEFPVAAVTGEGSPFVAGIGPAKAGLKFNFYSNERKGVLMAFYPQIEFAVAGSRSVKNGLAEPGQTLSLPLLASREFKYLTFVANGTVNVPIHDLDRETTGAFAVAFGRAMRRKLAAMVEVHAESTFDLERDRLVTLNGGLIRGLGRYIVYGNVGHSLFSDDGVGHTYVGFGLKVLLTPSAHSP